MEGNDSIDLLWKFSHAVGVLKYYGWISEWEMLMQSLWIKTKREWIDNFDGYCIAIKKRRKRVKYLRMFDYEFGKYLLDEELYKECELVIYMSSNFYDYNDWKLGVTFKKHAFYPFESFLSQVENKKYL